MSILERAILTNSDVDTVRYMYGKIVLMLALVIKHLI